MFVEHILAHKEGNVIFEKLYLIIFPDKVIHSLVDLSFFFCVKMDDGMIKFNSMNFSTWKCMLEDLLYCKDLYKPIRLKEKPFDMLDED